LRGKRLCESDEIRMAYYNKSTLNLDNFFVSQTFVDVEFIAKQTSDGWSIIPLIYVVNYVIRGYGGNYWYQARAGADYVPIDYPNPCYPNSIDSPYACMTFAYFRCCI
jgi:hypothetical protein